ncbi:hypothetical protein KY285_016362 [Solanum tuberosum]|nr:hypothetical protein KY285_016362 [Solanum tuberosum]
MEAAAAVVWLVHEVPLIMSFPGCGGTGRHGGNCHLEELPNIGSSQELLKTSFEYNTDQCAVGMTVQRRDGHSSLYYLCPRLDQLLSTTKTATTGVPD